MGLSITSNLTKFEINPDFDIEGYIHIVKTAPADIKPDTLLISPEKIKHTQICKGTRVSKKTSKTS